MARLPGETFTVWVTVTDDDGALANVVGAMMLTYYDPTKTAQGSVTMTNPATGTYRGDINVPASPAFGEWIAEAAGTSGTTIRKINRLFEVGAIS